MTVVFSERRAVTVCSETKTADESSRCVQCAEQILLSSERRESRKNRNSNFTQDRGSRDGVPAFLGYFAGVLFSF